MSSPASINRKVSQHGHDIDSLYELLEGVDGRIAELQTGQVSLQTGLDGLKSDQQALSKKVDDGFGALNEKLDLLLTRISGGDSEATPTA
jgi:hypothetical protein